MTITDPARSTAADPAPGSRWLEGNFGPVGVETTAYDLEVTGAIPPALAGRRINHLCQRSEMNRKLDPEFLVEMQRRQIVLLEESLRRLGGGGAPAGE